MSAKLHVFLSGATGYIGGAILQNLLNHPRRAQLNFTALVRSAEKAEKLKAFGVASVIGSLSDVAIIEDWASNSDVVFALANADDVPSAEAILRGLKKRYETTGKQPIFINCSGTGEFIRDTRGLGAYDEIYDDANPEQIESLPDTAPHRDVDLRIVAAGKAGYAKTYIVLPSTIYSIAKGPLFEAGIANKYSQQIPCLIKAALDRGQGGMIGKGLNLWPNVDIHDVADLFILVLDYALTNPSTGHGREGYYFGENGEHSYYESTKAISKALVELGRGKSEEPTTFTEEEIKKYFGGTYGAGSTSRAVANRSRSIGWKPKKTKADFLASIRPEVEALIAQGY